MSHTTLLPVNHSISPKVPVGVTSARKHAARDCATCPTRKNGVFCDLASTSTENLNTHKTTNHYTRGQILFYEGNPANGIFCIRNGKYKVYKNGSDGKETIFKIAQAGDVLGYESVITQQNHHATVEVLEDGDVCFVATGIMKDLLKKDAALALTASRKMGESLFEMESRFSDMMNKSVRNRFINLLLKLEKQHGRQERPGSFLNVKLTRHELGAMVGATSETVIRLLSDLSREDLVELDGKRIYLKNLEELAENIDSDE